MIEYFLHALPTATLVLVYFVRTETRLTRIETLLEVLMKRDGCEREDIAKT